MNNSVDGINNKSLADNSTSVFFVKKVSSRFRELIKKHLVGICEGEYRATEEQVIYTLNRTIDLFLQRYKTKNGNLKKGMVGELYSHLLIVIFNNELSLKSPYFNLEENHIKKGFDGIYLNETINGLFYLEVKSTGGKESEEDEEEVTDILASHKALIKKASDDIFLKISQKNDNLWHNALNGLDIISFKKNETKEIKKILAMGLDNKVKVEDSNVILSSVVFGAAEDIDFEIANLTQLKNEIKEKQKYKAVITLSIHKGEFNDIVNILEEIRDS